MNSEPQPKSLSSVTRVDHLLIEQMVTTGSRVLDVGCGNGELLKLLAHSKKIDGRGLEISQEGVNHCVSKGLSVVQGDADHDLINYPDNAFDFAILSQTVQATNRPKHVVDQLLRIGRRAIVSFPNFGHWRIRCHLLFNGRMPVTENLPIAWYKTPNIHFCTINDFIEMCDELDAKIEQSVALKASGQKLGFKVPLLMQNLIGEQAIFLLRRHRD